MTTDNGFDAWFMGTKNGRRPNFQSRNDRREKAAWEAGRASRDAQAQTYLAALMIQNGLLRETHEALKGGELGDGVGLNAQSVPVLARQMTARAEAAEARVRELERELADSEAGYKSAMDSITDLGNEMRGREDAALGMVATLRKSLREWEHWYSEDSSEFNRELARGAGLAALASTSEAARQHDERIRSEERERILAVVHAAHRPVRKQYEDFDRTYNTGVTDAEVVIRALGSEKP